MTLSALITMQKNVIPGFEASKTECVGKKLECTRWLASRPVEQEVSTEAHHRTLRARRQNLDPMLIFRTTSVFLSHTESMRLSSLRRRVLQCDTLAPQCRGRSKYRRMTMNESHLPFSLSHTQTEVCVPPIPPYRLISLKLSFVPSLVTLPCRRSRGRFLLLSNCSLSLGSELSLHRVVLALG